MVVAFTLGTFFSRIEWCDSFDITWQGVICDFLLLLVNVTCLVLLLQTPLLLLMLTTPRTCSWAYLLRHLTGHYKHVCGAAAAAASAAAAAAGSFAFGDADYAKNMQLGGQQGEWQQSLWVLTQVRVVSGKVKQ
jgi:hypothetical protein